MRAMVEKAVTEKPVRREAAKASDPAAKA